MKYRLPLTWSFCFAVLLLPQLCAEEASKPGAPALPPPLPQGPKDPSVADDPSLLPTTLESESAATAAAVEDKEEVGDPKVIACKKNITTLATAAINFAAKHRGNLPATMETLGFVATKSTSPVRCPFDPSEKYWGYEMRLRGVLLSGIAEPAKTPLLAARFAGPDGKRWVAFVDGHVERLDKVPVVMILDRRAIAEAAAARARDRRTR